MVESLVTGQVGITSMGVNQLGYLFREGLRNIFSHGLMSFASSCMVLVSLLIMGSFTLVAVNIDNMLQGLEDDNEFLAYVDDSLDDNAARALQGSIESVENVADVIFVSREEAYRAFVEKNPDQKLFLEVPENTLRHRYRVHVDDIELLTQTVNQVRQIEGIAKVGADYEVAEGFVMLRNVVSVVAIIMVVVLLTVSLFIISNTVRITTFTRKEEIAIMKMCGATDWFIRWPFLFEGVLLGLLGATLAFFLQWGVYSVLHTAVGNVANLAFIELVPFVDMAKTVLLAFLGAGFVIGAGGSAMAIRKFLRV